MENGIRFDIACLGFTKQFGGMNVTEMRKYMRTQLQTPGLAHMSREDLEKACPPPKGRFIFQKKKDRANNHVETWVFAPNPVVDQHKDCIAVDTVSSKYGKVCNTIALSFAQEQLKCGKNVVLTLNDENELDIESVDWETQWYLLDGMLRLKPPISSKQKFVYAGKKRTLKEACNFAKRSMVVRSINPHVLNTFSLYKDNDELVDGWSGAFDPRFYTVPIPPTLTKGSKLIVWTDITIVVGANLQRQLEQLFRSKTTIPKSVFKKLVANVKQYHEDVNYWKQFTYGRTRLWELFLVGRGYQGRIDEIKTCNSNKFELVWTN